MFFSMEDFGSWDGNGKRRKLAIDKLGEGNILARTWAGIGGILNRSTFKLNNEKITYIFSE
jgi:hypothetical protein